MKRFFRLLGAIFLGLAIVACSNGKSGNNTSNSNDLIEFDNVILMDDDTVTVNLVNFYAEDINWNTGKRHDKHMTLKVTNKSDHKFIFDLQDSYLGTDEVNHIWRDGNSGPAPGKSKTYEYTFYHDTKPNPKELESLDQLYDLEFVIEIHNYDKAGDKLVGSYETTIKLSDVLN